MGKKTPAPATADEAKVPASPEVDGAGATPATDTSTDTAQGTSAPDAPAPAQEEATPSKKGFVTLDCSFGQICIDGENYQSSNGKVTVPKELAEKAKKICG